MNRCNILGLVLTAALALVPAVMAQDRLEWQPSLTDAQVLARQHGRLVLLHFWSESCPPCLRLEKSVFHRREFVRAVHANFVPVKVNVYENRELARRFEIKSIPTDVVLTSDGHEIFRSTSPQDVNRYVGMLDEVAAHARLAMRPSATADYSAESVPVHADAPPVQASTTESSRSNVLQPPGREQSRFETPTPSAPGQPQINPFVQPTAPQRSEGGSIYADQFQPMKPPVQPPPHLHPQQPPASATPEPAPSRYSDGQPASENIHRGGLAPSSFDRPAGPPEGSRNEAAWAAGGGMNNGPPQQTQPGIDAAPSRYAMRETRAPQMPAGPNVSGMPQGQVPPNVGMPPHMQQRHAQAPAMQPNAGRQMPGAVAGPDMRQLSHPAPVVNGNRPMLPPGLDGYCPVMMVDHDRWTPGDPRWAADFEQRSYWFAGPEQRDQFFRDPARYSPRLGGFDVVRFREQGIFVPGRREHGVELDQPHRYFLFSDEASLQRFWSNPGFYEAALRGPPPGTQRR